MPPDTCSICGGPADDAHHLTGRGPGHVHLDPDLVAPLCHDDHELVHEDLRQEALDNPTVATSPTRQVAFRLRRAAIFLARVADANPALGWLVHLASALRRWADELLEGDLDATV
jgi:hypothetical protein